MIALVTNNTVAFNPYNMKRNFTIKFIQIIFIVIVII